MFSTSIIIIENNFAGVHMSFRIQSIIGRVERWFCLPLRHMEVTFRWEIAFRVEKFNYWKPRYCNQRRIEVAFGGEIGSRVQQFDLWTV